MRRLAREYGFNSCCAVPILSKNEGLGAITLFHSSPDIFTEQNISVLEEFSDQAAIAISNVQLRRTLIESESLKEIILQSVNEAIVLVDWTGSIITANIAAQKLLDRKKSDVKNFYYSDVFGEDNPVSEPITKWLHDRSIEDNSQGWLELKDDRKVFLSVDVSSVVVEGMPCLHLTMTDLTMQKKMNASLEHAAKLSTVGHIATQIAHEIGNPLTLISSQIQRMVRDETTDIAQLRNLLGHIDRISSLIRRFSDLGSKRPLLTSPEAIEPIIENILGLISFSRPFDGVEISKEFTSGLPLVEMDKNKITQVLLNMLLNAADACDGHGKITIEAKVKSVPIEINNERTESDYLLVSISDDGSGIEPATLKRIFEPFYTTKAMGKGTGLGLSVSLAIIDQHQGWINVESEVSKGSMFSIYLPMKKAAVKKKIAIEEVSYEKSAAASHKAEEIR
jgi:two-component system NtrC family sensor kinase